MQGLGEVLNDSKTKAFVRNKLIDETSSALELFSAFPLISKQDQKKLTAQDEFFCYNAKMKKK